MDTIGKRLFQDTDMTGTLVSEPVDLNNMVHIGIHNKWTGTPAGDLFFEVSGELGEPTIWETLDSASVSGAGTQFWIDRNAPYKWARVRYVPTGSTGLLTSHAITKGDL
jgi:hypothetical protein